MRAILQFLAVIAALAAMGSFIVGLITHLMLMAHLDSENVRKKTGGSKFWLLANPIASIEVYQPGGHRLWNIRYACIQIFQIGAGLTAILLFVLAR